MLTNNPLNNQLQQYIALNPQAIGQQISLLEESLREGQISIWNKAFDLLPAVTFIDSGLHQKYARLAEEYHQLLRKLLVLYRERPEVRSWFSFPPLVESLCMLDPGYDNEIVICRFDSYPTEDGFKILENNTDCPAGVLFTHHHRQAITELPLISSFLRDNVQVAGTLNQSDEAFFHALLQAHENRTGRQISKAFCILQPEGKISAEVKLMQQVLEGMGIVCVIADPGSLTYKNGQLYHEQTAIEVIWNKINTCYFDEMLTQPGRTAALIRAICENKVTHVNSFASRYVTESKRSLALMKDARFRHLFTAEENALIEKLLPWACAISEAEVSYRGSRLSAVAHALANKDAFVLKMPYDIRGEGVILGKDSTDEVWRQAVENARKNRSILQEYIAIQQCPVYSPNTQNLANYNMSLDFFMYNGKFAGFGSKISKNLKVNIFQGGSKNIILPIL
ncbi:circularly permuted type 2 ATP-grasp protein [Erwinia sp. BC051422]|uniref:circularly permuted type 2 ATP-grasp protein n=1 Tax=Erwinia wuhanensis TaxID=3045167 RepID=UPI00265353F7|nr:circularly permuted type 2 ATP-grasp protein [Erwinia sp. BC051422]MDN8541821.1 circularly permuted type 2 ATP-grasp protein [Erwinia sp. BC051422]